MICDLCRTREAVIFLEQMGKNIKRKINLCAECAAARGIAAPVPAPNQQNVAALFQEIAERNMALESESKRVCPSCGKSILDIKSQGIAGCPECYEVFKAEIRESMNAHGITGTYTGSMPLRVKGFRNALTDRADLFVLKITRKPPFTAIIFVRLKKEALQTVQMPLLLTKAPDVHKQEHIWNRL